MPMANWTKAQVSVPGGNRRWILWLPYGPTSIVTKEELASRAAVLVAQDEDTVQYIVATGVSREDAIDGLLLFYRCELRTAEMKAGKRGADSERDLG